jgi:hypothetical protein
MIGKPFERVFGFPMMSNLKIKGWAIQRASLASLANDLLSSDVVADLDEKLGRIPI